MKYLPKHEEEQIVWLLPLDLLEQKPAGFWFRCPVCGDSKISYKKKRGWILTGREHLVYYCFNCGYTASFKRFLREYFPEIYKEYYEKKLKEYWKEVKKEKTIVYKKKSEIKVEKEETENEIKLISIDKFKWINVENSLEASNFLKKRKIPEEKWNFFRYSLDEENDKGFLIIPFFYKNESQIYGYQIRSLVDKVFKIRIPEGNPKVWNLFNVDWNREVFVFEGVFDAIFVENSIALLGADIPKYLEGKLKNCIFVFDNDLTGLEKTEKYLKKGLKCVIFPLNFYYKDINDWVKEENPEGIEEFLKNHIYEDWRKAKVLIGMKKKILKRGL